MKRLLLFLLLFAGLSYSADTGWRNGTSFTTGCEGVAWVDANNAQYNDSSYSTVTAARRRVVDTGCLQATDYGFTIPTGSTINGVLVEIRKYSTGAGGSVVDAVMTLLPSSSDKALAGSWATSATSYLHGGASDSWGETWTPAEINDASFGAQISAHVVASTTESQVASIDWIGIKVFYTPPASGNTAPNQGFIYLPSYIHGGKTSVCGINIPDWVVRWINYVSFWR